MTLSALCAPPTRFLTRPGHLFLAKYVQSNKLLPQDQPHASRQSNALLTTTCRSPGLAVNRAACCNAKYPIGFQILHCAQRPRQNLFPRSLKMCLAEFALLARTKTPPISTASLVLAAPILRRSQGASISVHSVPPESTCVAHFCGIISTGRQHGRSSATAAQEMPGPSLRVPWRPRQ